MKARLVPLFFDPGRNEDFDTQLDAMKTLLGDAVEFLAPVPLGASLPESEAVVFPQLLREAYRLKDAFRAIDRPILFITSPFGTLSMWDWEIASYMRAEGVETIAPYTPEQAKTVCRALAVRRALRQTKFLAYQDDPGEGFQADIFKRFYWWEDECTQRIQEKFGIAIERRSFRDLGARAKEISDRRADDAWHDRQVPLAGVSQRAVRSAMKLYLAVRDDLDADAAIAAVGMNCLNESHFADTTPCLAWNLLYAERDVTWGCEADTMSMLTQHILHKSLGVPAMMTNFYPFLLGGAALAHERIDKFPDVPAEPENHILIAHCGYVGVIPQAHASEWTLKEKVLAIVDRNATAIDARLPTGPVTLAKLHPSLSTLTVAEGSMEGYAQYPGSDCLNGGVIKVRDGRKIMDSLVSHHYLVLTGHCLDDIRLLRHVFDFDIDEI